MVPKLSATTPYHPPSAHVGLNNKKGWRPTADIEQLFRSDWRLEKKQVPEGNKRNREERRETGD